MTPFSVKDLRGKWIANAARLDSRGYFARYSAKQKREVLKKGFLGPLPPDRIILIARQHVKDGYEFQTPKFVDEMRENWGIVGDDIREALLDLLGEIPPESYEPPRELAQPPGCPFVFYCKRLGCKIYFKIQVDGTPQKPRVLLWSCHPPMH